MSPAAIRWLHTWNLLFTLALFGAALGWSGCPWWLGLAGCGGLWAGLLLEELTRLSVDRAGVAEV